MSAVAVLRAARELIAEPSAWGQQQAVLNAPKDAPCRCAAMAIDDAAAELKMSHRPALRALAAAIEPEMRPHDLDDIEVVIAANDAPQMTHAAVLGWFDRAIIAGAGA